jgi:ATP-binding cassette subfamily F protein 3
MLRMLLKPINLLILDEPTNHLDMQSKDILLDCLKTFEGTIIFVSHDRLFMEALSTKTLELSYGRPLSHGKTVEETRQHRLFFGNYAYYLDRIAREASLSTSGETNESALLQFSSLTLLDSNAGGEASLSPIGRREQEKQRQTHIRRLERQEAEILKVMEKLEAEKAKLETELSRPEVYSSGEKAKAVKQKLDECSAALEAKSLEWEPIAEELRAVNKTSVS